MIPLILRLKRQAHRDIAKAQDVIVEALYAVFPDAVIHGGTAIWRCYQGNRFSEDIDAYIPQDKERVALFFEKLTRRGFQIDKKKIGEASIYSQLHLNRTAVRFEALFKNVNGHLKDYETAEGNWITISTLTPEELIKEKVSAYLGRRKIRDLYDIFVLLRHVSVPADIKKDLNQLIAQFKDPIDEPELAVLILEGIVPMPAKMLEYVKNWK